MAGVYVLSHVAVRDHLKIGFTSRAIDERLDEVMGQAPPQLREGLVLERVYLLSEPVARKLEAMLHRRLSHTQVRGDRSSEWFRIDMATVEDVVASTIRAHNMTLAGAVPATQGEPDG